MRLLLEILLIGLLVFVGWRQPFRDVVHARFPQTEITPSRLAMRALEAENNASSRAQGQSFNQPARGSSGDWMYNEPSALDAKPKRAQ